MRTKTFAILLLRIVVFSALMGLLASCGILDVRTELPNSKESSSIKAGQEAIVLLRVTADSDDGKRVGTFDNIHQGDNVNLGLCKYVPQGEVEIVLPQRFLSSEAKKQGWIYLVVEPGTHYLSFIGTCGYDTLPGRIECPELLNRARQWQINIPKNTQMVYVGSMHMRCSSKFLLFEDPLCSRINERKMVVRNEENLAKTLITEHLSDFGSFRTELMKPHD